MSAIKSGIRTGVRSRLFHNILNRRNTYEKKTNNKYNFPNSIAAIGKSSALDASKLYKQYRENTTPKMPKKAASSVAKIGRRNSITLQDIDYPKVINHPSLRTIQYLKWRQIFVQVGFQPNQKKNSQKRE